MDKSQCEADSEKNADCSSLQSGEELYYSNINESPLNLNPVPNSKDVFDTDEEYESETCSEIFQTPLSVSYFSKRLASSTPMTNNKSIETCDSDHKTPEGRRKLYNKNLKFTPSSANDSKYFPVSSPTTSENLKLNDSSFLNSESSVVCNQDILSNIVNKTDLLGNDSFLPNNNNNNVSAQDCLYLNNNSCDNSVTLKFKSFDLIPGIMPLNDSDS